MCKSVNAYIFNLSNVVASHHFISSSQTILNFLFLAVDKPMCIIHPDFPEMYIERVVTTCKVETILCKKNCIGEYRVPDQSAYWFVLHLDRNNVLQLRDRRKFVPLCSNSLNTQLWYIPLCSVHRHTIKDELRVCLKLLDYERLCTYIVYKFPLLRRNYK